jgi:hypothetical protein
MQQIADWLKKLGMSGQRFGCRNGTIGSRAN